MNKIINFIDHLYESINIYQTLIIYNDMNYDINDLKILLEEKDYPVCIIDDNISIKENNFRVFIMNVNIFLNGYINTKRLDLSKVNIILCLDDVSLNKTNNYLNNKELNINLADELYIFSIDNV
jgi:hypothetical protein